ncbi:MAG: F0F1 ATP synthase subunit A [Patescibacteria group bacterium]
MQTATSENLTTEVHAGPHIPGLSGEAVGLHIGSIELTTTVISTWVLMIFVITLSLVIGFFANKKDSIIRAFGKNIVRRLDSHFTSLIGDRATARKFFPIIGAFFIFIFMANIAGLVFDWIGLIFPKTLHYLRPINADLSTTLILGTTVVFIAQVTSIIYKGFFTHFGHYLFNFSGSSIVEKIINVPIGWIHFIGEFTRILSLSVRLFCNIFAGIALIGIMSYLGTLLHAGFVGGLLVLPFWFFEIFVAFLQAFIFMTLSGVYLKEAVTVAHH